MSIDLTKYRVVADANQIKDAQSVMAAKINQLHAINPKPSTAVCVLNGGVMHFAHTVQGLNFDIDFDFCKATSYVDEFTKAGEFELWRPSSQQLFPGQRIYIFDDILDTGDTAEQIARWYTKWATPAELVLCTLVARTHSPIEYLKRTSYAHIFTGLIDDDWLIGYGMNDSNGFNRNLPQIYAEI